jgi:mono/diheme cytochrome c family protein
MIGAILTLMVSVAGCGRQDQPAPKTEAPAVAAIEPVLDGADKLTHGRYLVETVGGCGNCHTPHLPDLSLDPSKKFSGAFVIKEPVFEAHAANITPDMETGIGAWSEDDIVHAIRNGQRPDGRYLGPPMSFGWYRGMSDTDVHAIAAYIKSVPAVRNAVPQSTYQFPLTGYGPPVTHVPDMPKTDPVAYGAYLAGPIGHCMDCHTTYVAGRIDLKQLGRGGNLYTNLFNRGVTAMSANITSDTTAGLGNWTDDEIKRAITAGVSRNGRVLAKAMPYALYARMAPSDLNALVAYLRTLPALASSTATAPAAKP